MANFKKSVYVAYRFVNHEYVYQKAYIRHASPILEHIAEQTAEPKPLPVGTELILSFRTDKSGLV